MVGAGSESEQLPILARLFEYQIRSIDDIPEITLLVYDEPLSARVHDVHRDGLELKRLSRAPVDDYPFVLPREALVDVAREGCEGRAVRHVVPVDHDEPRVDGALAVDVRGS